MARLWFSAVLVLCAVALVAAQYPVALFQRQGDGTCQDFTLGACHSCTNNCGETRYFQCTSDGDDIDCISSMYSNCQNHDSHPYVHHSECGQLGACAIGYQQKFTVEWSVDASSTLAAYSEPHGRDSYVQMSGSSAVTQGHVTNVLYVSGNDQVRFETAFNETTYLTSAGTCAFNQQCYAGDLAYTASILPLANVTEPELQGTRVEIHTDGLVGFKNADSTGSFTAFLGDELNLGSDELSEVMIEATVRGETVVLSNLVLGRADGDAPILYFEVEAENGLSEYDYVTCEWEGRYESSEAWYALSTIAFSYGWWYDDALDAVTLEERGVAGTPTPTATLTASASNTRSPSNSRTLSPTSTTSNTMSSSNSPSRSSARPTSTPTPSRTASRECSALYIEPQKGNSNEEYVRCSLDRLFDSDEFFSYGGFGSFDSFAQGRAAVRPLSKVWSAINGIASIFRL